MHMPVAGPHTHTLFTVSRTMLTVVAAVTPATLFGLWEFGWPAIFLFLTTVVSAWVFEVACLKIAHKPIRPFPTDGSAILSGWLVAMTLPPYAPWWVGVIGSFIAIVIAKHLFGGLGQNLFNPAMVARAMLVVALPVQMTTWIAPVGLLEASITLFGSHVPAQLAHQEQISRATWQILPSWRIWKAVFWASCPAAWRDLDRASGTGRGFWLLVTRIITPTIPLGLLGTLSRCRRSVSFLAPDPFAPPILHLTSGSTMLCAFFIATDYVTSPVTTAGKWVYGIGIGTLVFVIPLRRLPRAWPLRCS
nr:rnfD [Rhodobacter capsulatus]prf//2009377A rnfD protein [Rhodobacter capsulatus]